MNAHNTENTQPYAIGIAILSNFGARSGSATSDIAATQNKGLSKITPSGWWSSNFLGEKLEGISLSAAKRYPNTCAIGQAS